MTKYLELMQYIKILYIFLNELYVHTFSTPWAINKYFPSADTPILKPPLNISLDKRTDELPLSTLYTIDVSNSSRYNISFADNHDPLNLRAANFPSSTSSNVSNSPLCFACDPAVPFSPLEPSLVNNTATTMTSTINNTIDNIIPSFDMSIRFFEPTSS